MITELRSRVGGTRVMRASGRYLENPFASVQLMLAAGGGLLFFGLMMSASTTISASLHTTGDDIWSQLIREFAFLILSIPVFWIAVRMPPAAYRRLAYPALALALILLVGVLVPGIGATINGAQRWMQFGPLTLQPSEFAKLAVLLWGADLLARKESLKTLKSAKHVMLPLVPGFVAIIALVMLEPDLGTSLCFVMILMGLLWMVGLPYRYFMLIFLGLAGAVTALAVTEPYRLQRLTTFLHPSVDAQSHGYQALHGLWALSSGGVFGVGLGRGTLKYGWVPNANTDYVFAVVGEELGLLGTTAVLFLFGLFTYAGMRIAFRSKDPFVRLVASGAGIWIAGQALINIGYVTGLLPVTGIPLPFISSGGTSLILTCGVLGMLVSFARHEPAAVKAAQRAAEAGSTTRWVRTLCLGTPKTAQPKVRSNSKAATGTSAKPPAKAPTKPPAKPPAGRQPHPARGRPVHQPAANSSRQPARQPVTHTARQPVTRTPTPSRVAPAAGRLRSAAPASQGLRPTGSDSAGRRPR